MYDVVVLGAGMAGATAAYRLRDRKLLIIEPESFVGGRTYSESFDSGSWANYGAGYFSADKHKIFELGDEVGVDFVSFDDSALTGTYMPDYLDREDVRELRAVFLRIQEEQSNRRPADDPSLDKTSFADWLGDELRPNVMKYLDGWCSTMSAPPEKLSLYGALLMHGIHRVSAFSDEPVEMDQRGHSVIKGGNSMLAQKLVEASKAELRLETRAEKVERLDNDLYQITAVSGDKKTQVQCRVVISAVPAPVVLQIFDSLPEWKTRCLSEISYGRLIGMPVVVAPLGSNEIGPVPDAAYREDAVYCETEFILRSPTDIERQGAYFVCQVYDSASRVIWDDSDDSIRAGVYNAFVNKHPGYADRVQKIGVHRWEHGLPIYHLGRMACEQRLQEPVEGVFFCGDYSDLTHTHGAAVSGERAAADAREFLHQSGGDSQS